MSDRHYCRPAGFVRDFPMDGVTWLVPVCECGQELTPRTAKGRLAPPMIEARLNRTFGHIPVHRHLTEQTVCRWGDL